MTPFSELRRFLVLVTELAAELPGRNDNTLRNALQVIRGRVELRLYEERPLIIGDVADLLIGTSNKIERPFKPDFVRRVRSCERRFVLARQVALSRV